MLDFLDKLDHQELFSLAGGTVVTIAGSLVAIVAIIATAWRRTRVAEMQLALKQQMLEKGMSAAEIEQVMRASQEPAPAVAAPLILGNDVHDKAAVVQHLVDNGYHGEDIERVLKAYQSDSKVSADKLLTNAP